VVAAGTSQPPAGTLVTLSSDIGEIIQQQTPEGSGRFQFVFVRRGIYYVTARAPGYRDASARADIFSLRRQSVFLTLVPDRQSQPTAPPSDPVVDERQLRIPQEAREEFERGTRELYEKKSPEASLVHFRRALGIYPEYYEAHYMMGTAYMDQQKWLEAEAEFKSSLEINDRHAASYIALGAMYNQQGKPEEAAALLERGVELKGDAWQGRFELALACLALGRVEDAEAHALRAHELAPGFPPAHVLLANVLLRKSDFPAAEREFQHYLELAPDGPLAGEVKARLAEIEGRRQTGSTPAAASPVPPEAWQEFNEGRMLLVARQLAPALARFRKAAEIHPEFVEAHHMTATVLLEQKDWAGAEQEFRRCLEINRNYAPSYVGLGMMYNLQGKPAEAAVELQRAVEADPNAWQAHFELAQTQLALRQVPEAETHALRAHELQPEQPLVHVVLGNVYLAEKKLPPAREEFQHYVDLDPEGPLALRLKARIKEIDAALAGQPTPPPN
jgi:tetratricopeptide (TPR) repeat protein